MSAERKLTKPDIDSIKNLLKCGTTMPARGWRTTPGGDGVFFTDRNKFLIKQADIDDPEYYEKKRIETLQKIKDIKPTDAGKLAGLTEELLKEIIQQFKEEKDVEEEDAYIYKLTNKEALLKLLEPAKKMSEQQNTPSPRPPFG